MDALKVLILHNLRKNIHINERKLVYKCTIIKITVQICMITVAWTYNILIIFSLSYLYWLSPPSFSFHQRCAQHSLSFISSVWPALASADRRGASRVRRLQDRASRVAGEYVAYNTKGVLVLPRNGTVFRPQLHSNPFLALFRRSW